MNEHKKIIYKILSQYFPSVFYQLCPADAGFPRAEYEIKQLNVEGYPYDKYLLTINAYDKAQTETIDGFIDNLIKGIDKSIHYTSDFYYQFYYGKDRQPIAETDKNLKRIMLTFEVRIYTRSEE